MGREYLTWMEGGGAGTTLDWWGGVPTLDRLCCGRYASCSFLQEDLLVNLGNRIGRKRFDRVRVNFSSVRNIQAFFFHCRHPAMVSLQQAKSLVQNLIQTVSTLFNVVYWLLRNM